MLCQQHWWLVPSLFLIIFFFWGSFFKRPLANFLVLGVLKGWLLFFPSPRLLDSTFLDPPFGFFPFCHFSQVSWFLSARLKVSQPHSFIVLLSGFPKIPAPCSWIVGSQVFWSPFCIIIWLIGMYLFFFFVGLGMPHWIVSIPTWLYYMSRGSQAPGNPQVSWPNSFLRLLSDFLAFEAWVGLFLLLYSMGFETYPFMDLGPSL